MIVMKNICKTYKVAKRNAGFKEAARSFLRRETETVTALDHVSFTIHDGETVGYIGPNGYVELVGKRSYKMNVHISVILYDN